MNSPTTTWQLIPNRKACNKDKRASKLSKRYKMTLKKERRKYPRFKKQFKAHCITTESKRGGDECTVINVSLKGVGVVFHTSEKIRVGSSVILEIPASQEHEHHSVKGVIKWLKKRENDYMGGIELAELFDALPRAKDTMARENGTAEDRIYIRFSTNLKAWYSIRETGEGWGECTVFNVSRKGMGVNFHATETIETGSAIHLKIIIPSETEPMNVKGTLRWVKQVKNEYIGGIELTEVLDEIKSLIIMLEG